VDAIVVLRATPCLAHCSSLLLGHDEQRARSHIGTDVVQSNSPRKVRGRMSNAAKRRELTSVKTPVQRPFLEFSQVAKSSFEPLAVKGSGVQIPSAPLRETPGSVHLIDRWIPFLPDDTHRPG